MCVCFCVSDDDYDDEQKGVRCTHTHTPDITVCHIASPRIHRHLPRWMFVTSPPFPPLLHNYTIAFTELQKITVLIPHCWSAVTSYDVILSPPNLPLFLLLISHFHLPPSLSPYLFPYPYHISHIMASPQSLLPHSSHSPAPCSTPSRRPCPASRSPY